jgi:hypothetical protein
LPKGCRYPKSSLLKPLRQPLSKEISTIKGNLFYLSDLPIGQPLIYLGSQLKQILWGFLYDCLYYKSDLLPLWYLRMIQGLKTPFL